MSTTSDLLTDPRMAAAISELTGLILRSYPDTTFATEVDENGRSIFIWATVDVDDPDEVVDLFIDRLLTLQGDEELPLHVVPIRTPARLEKLRAELQQGRSSGAILRSAVG